jgi:hypothetical protein
MVSVMDGWVDVKHWWNDIDGGKNKVLREKPVPLPLCPPQIPHGLTQGVRELSTVLTPVIRL